MMKTRYSLQPNFLGNQDIPISLKIGLEQGHMETHLQFFASLYDPLVIYLWEEVGSREKVEEILEKAFISYWEHKSIINIDNTVIFILHCCKLQINNYSKSAENLKLYHYD